MIVYESDLKKMARCEMEDCVDYLNAGDMKKAHQCYGKARAYEDMLLDEGIDLEEECEDYKSMKDFYYEKGAKQ